jgi:hypothetical protein
MDASVLGIPLPVAKPVDTSRPHKRVIRGTSKFSPDITNITPGLDRSPLEIVVDTFSGKYYGEKPKESFLTYFEHQIKNTEAQIEYLNSRGYVEPINQGADFGIGGMLHLQPPKLSAEEKAATLKSYSDSIASSKAEMEKFSNSYIQKPQMIKSFETYGDNWNKHFEGNYRNPRLAEEQEKRQAQASNPKASQQSLAIADSKVKTVRTTGTGVSAPNTSNPFVSLDSGLNI